MITLTLTKPEAQILARAGFQGLKGTHQITFSPGEEAAAQALAVKLGRMAVELTEGVEA